MALLLDDTRKWEKVLGPEAAGVIATLFETRDEARDFVASFSA